MFGEVLILQFAHALLLYVPIFKQYFFIPKRVPGIFQHLNNKNQTIRYTSDRSASLIQIHILVFTQIFPGLSLMFSLHKYSQDYRSCFPYSNNPGCNLKLTQTTTTLVMTCFSLLGTSYLHYLHCPQQWIPRYLLLATKLSRRYTKGQIGSVQ